MFRTKIIGNSSTRTQTHKETGIVQALTTFFSWCDRVVGHESNYQNMLCTALETEHPGQVRREHAVADAMGGTFDVAVVDDHENCIALFEIKGGAYNSRSSLKDELRKGIPKDIAKLSSVNIPASRKWIVLIDATREFGRSLRSHEQQEVFDDATSYGVSSSYYGHGDSHCTIVSLGGGKIHYDVDTQRKPGQACEPLSLFGHTALNELLTKVKESLSSEADIVVAIYRTLLSEGFIAAQIATEAYFGFAPRADGQAMQERPDLCLFEPSVDGHFNLYPKGDTTKSYDLLKLNSLKMMVEIKGGAALATRAKTNAKLKSIYSTDIEKLGNWRRIVERRRKSLSIADVHTRFVFVGVDTRTAQLGADEIQKLSNQANHEKVEFLYIPLV